MSSFLPPSDRIWWNVPVGKQEIVWIGIALVWCLIMFFMMPYWHIYGKQNLSNEAYQTTPAKFQTKVDEMVEQYQVKDENGDLKYEAGIPVVRPPAGSDIYLLGRLWQWYPIFELEKISLIECIFHRWTGTTVSLCSRLILICKSFLVMKWWLP